MNLRYHLSKKETNIFPDLSIVFNLPANIQNKKYMPTTTCEIAGEVYQLDYTKLPSKRGIYYFGKIHSQPVMGFAFTALVSGGNEFDDSREPIQKQEAIVNAINSHEKSS